MHRPQQFTCQFCNFTSNSEVRIQLHVVSEHSQKPSTLVCPLCSDVFREWDVLQNHLEDAHLVKKEYLTEAMSLVDETDWLALQTISNSDKQSLECKAQGNDKSPTFFNPQRQLDKDEQPKQARISLEHRENSVSPVVPCGREFSSICVLKGHKEEIHRDVETIKVVQKLADEFREDYERRNAFVSVVDDATKMVEVPSSSYKLGTGECSAPAIPSGDAPLAVPNVATAPVKSLGFQMPDVPSSMTANHNAQMQFNQILMRTGNRMGLPMPMNLSVNMNLPYASAVNMHLPCIPIMIPPKIDPRMAYSFGHPMVPESTVYRNTYAAQTFAEQLMSQQQKRTRTKIKDDQLKILRAYFEEDSSPTYEQLLDLSDKLGLPWKKIKHWFQYNLFKERQRNKDSPYNLNNPPSTYLNLEEYEKSGEIKITPVIVEKPSTPKNMDNSDVEKKNESPENNF